LPRGGLYIAGGLATRMMARMRSRFLTGFLAKGRMQRVLLEVPVHIVLDPQVGLRGAAARVFAEMSRFPEQQLLL
jgi:glucokinase